MANDKKFVVKNGLTAQNISFVDDTQSTNNTITVSMIDSDTLSFSGNSGQLLSITDTLSGEKLQVNGKTKITSVDNGTGDFLTRDANGVITRRTAAQVLTDIGAEGGFTKGNLVAGTNVTLSGTLTDRLVGTGNVTVNAAATNLGITAGTTAGPVVTSSTGTNATLPTATATNSGVVTTGAQTWAGVKTFNSTITGSISGNAGTATTLQTARTIGGVSFNGSANINLPGVNAAGNQNTSGSAASLTTARTLTIGSTGKTFNGTADVAWSLAEIGVNNSTLTLATSGIATGSQTFTSNQGTAATFTVNVPATNLSATAGTTAGPVINSSTGTNVTIPSASGTASGIVTTGTQTFAGEKTFSGNVTGTNLTLSGNLTVNGTTTTLNTTNTVIKDNLIELNNGVASNANDSGIVIERGTTGDNAFIGWDENADKFIVGTTTATGTGTGNLIITPGTLVANIEGNLTGAVTGNATTATTLQTARTINGVSFNGSANITLPTVDTSGDQTISGAKTFSTGIDVTGTAGLDMNNNDIFGVDQIFHHDDTDTYIQFHALNQFRVVTGGVERFEVNASAVTIAGELNVRTAIDLEDSNALRMGSSDDFKMFYNGIANEMEFEMEEACNQIRIHDNGTTRFTLARATGNFTATGNITADNVLATNVTITGALSANGSIGTTGQTLRSDGTKSFWSTEVGFTGSQGTTGFTGSRGFTGSQGVIGFTGSRGVIGFTGSQGVIGFTGSQGVIGFTGSIGNTGFTGSRGLQGFTGSAGPSTTINAVNDNTATTHFPVFVAGTGNQTARLSDSGNILSFVPSTGSLNSVDFNSTSDMTLKENIELLDNALERLLSINGVSYNFKFGDRKKRIGVLAQEVEAVVPEAVSENSEGYKTVSYGNMTGLIIEAIKDLKKEIDALKNK